MPGDTQRSGDSLSGGPGNDWLDPGHDPRRTRGSAAEDHEVVTYKAAGPVRVDLGTGPTLGTVTGEGVDTIVLSPTRLRIIGSQQSDTFLGSFRPDWFDGQGGSDVIDGRGGDDHLLADGGDRPTSGDDRVAGGDGDDFLQSHDGRDRLIGGPGADQLRTTSRGATRLLGGAGPDRLRERSERRGANGSPAARARTCSSSISSASGRTTIDQHKGRLYRASKQRESVRGRIDGITEFELGFGRYRFLGSGRDEIVRALRSRGLTANGRGGDDALTGSRKRADVLDGGGGTDRLDGDPHEDVCVDGERLGPACPGQSLISQSTAPVGTVAPTSAVRPVTMPALWALSGCSIFIASSTTTRSPASTVLALLDRDLDDRALHRGGQGVAARAAAGLLAGRAWARAFGPPAAGREPQRAEPVGQADLEPPAADLDDHALRVGRLVVGISARRRRTAGMSLSNSVSIQRVCTANVVGGPPARTPGRRRHLRWNVSAVAMPSTSNSASARRERSSACWRSRPVTISLASSESKLPPITSPCSKPPSRRTPGPLGGLPHASARPGRAGSCGPGPRR